MSNSLTTSDKTMSNSLTSYKKLNVNIVHDQKSATFTVKNGKFIHPDKELVWAFNSLFGKK